LAIVEPFDKSQVGLCFDTQHAFAAGLLDPNEPRAFPGFEEPLFMARLQAIHLNDSKVPYAAKKDRHQLIGQGEMGAAMLQSILTDPRLQDVPFYLETPVNDERQYQEEISVCRSLVG
jgi:deoxyribonuclease-4